MGEGEAWAQIFLPCTDSVFLGSPLGVLQPSTSGSCRGDIGQGYWFGVPLCSSLYSWERGAWSQTHGYTGRVVRCSRNQGGLEPSEKAKGEVNPFEHANVPRGRVQMWDSQVLLPLIRPPSTTWVLQFPGAHSLAT